MPTIITYNNKSHSLQDGYTATLECEGKQMFTDVVIEAQAGEGGSVGDTEYVIGTPVATTLAVDSWNGSRYTLTIENYNVGSFGLQIGVPSDSSVINTQAMVEAALTISDYSSTAANTENGTPASASIVISAVNIPSTALYIWLFGLEAA
jgi:hypothetical protein